MVPGACVELQRGDEVQLRKRALAATASRSP